MGMSASYFTLVFSRVAKEHKQGQRHEKTATPGTHPGEKRQSLVAKARVCEGVKSGPGAVPQGIPGPRPN